MSLFLLDILSSSEFTRKEVSRQADITIGAREARAQLADLLGRVHYGTNLYVSSLLKKNGLPDQALAASGLQPHPSPTLPAAR